MKHSKKIILAFTLAAGLISCRKDEDQPDIIDPRESTIVITNEGNFGKNNASVSLANKDFSNITNDYYAQQNAGEPLGEVLQHVGFSGSKAYLVLNNSNKIEIVDRYAFKKSATVSTNLVNPRYIAFSGSSYYVTNNNFFDVKKVNIYSTADNSFQKSISFPNYAEKIVAAGGYIYVQTDGVTYDASFRELPTGHTITRISTAGNAVDKTITLPDAAIIRDMETADGVVYILTSDGAGSYLYKLAGDSGNLQQIVMKDIANLKDLAIDRGQLYFLGADQKVYQMAASSGAAPTAAFPVTAKNLYGFNVIDGNVLVADSDFLQNSTVRVYSTAGNLLKTFTTGMGTNGFYKN